MVQGEIVQAGVVISLCVLHPKVAEPIRGSLQMNWGHSWRSVADVHYG